jgi:hypothetical protein
MVNQLGPNYQAALAAMALADTREDDEDDENSLSRQYRDQIAAQETEDIFSTPQRVAGLELGFQSPFAEEQQPVMMKDGGEAQARKRLEPLPMPSTLNKSAVPESLPTLSTFGESAVPDTAAEEYARFLEASKKSKVPAPLPAMLKEKIFDPLTKGGLREEGVYYDTMTPQPITSKSPTTLFAGVPGAKVVELGGLQDTTLSGFVFARPSSKGKMVEDVVFVAPPYSKRASDILLRKAPERWVENPNQELERQVLLGHETEHLLKRRGNRDINETFDQLAKQAREEDFIGSFFKKPASALRSKFVKDAAGSASYLKDKFGVTLPSYFDPKRVGNYTFHEQVATLAGIEQAFGVDLTQDPVLRKTLFEDPDVRRAYSAVTGLRQTRLDPRDLPPYTLQPDIPYNPKAAEIRTKPVKKARGGEMFADPMGVPDSGPITADTRRALTTRQGLSAAEMMRLFQNVGREGVSNLESLARGSVSAVPGVVGDIESIFRDDKNRRFATSKEVERQYLPKRLTAPTKESQGFVEAGTFIDPTIALKAAKPVAKGAVAAGKALAPTAAEMLERVTPELAKPMYIVRPSGGFFPSSKTYTETPLSRLDEQIKETVKWQNLTQDTAPERAAALKFLDTKIRNYFKTQAGSVSDPVREALIAGRIKIPKDTELEEMYPAALVNAARAGDVTAMRQLERQFDKDLSIRGTKVGPQEPPAGRTTTEERDAFAEDYRQNILEQMKRNPQLIPDEMLLRLTKKDVGKLSSTQAKDKVAEIRQKLADNPTLFNTVFEEKFLRLTPYDISRYITPDAFEKYPSLYSNLKEAVSRQEGIMALQQGAPIIDVEGSPRILGQSFRDITTYAQMIPPAELERMDVPEVVNRVIQLKKANEGVEPMVKKAESLISAGKPVPENISTFGTNVLIPADDKGFVWREIVDPSATKIQAKLLGNSIAGYALPGTYGKLERGASALVSGDVRLFGLYDKNNQLMTNVEYITSNAKGKAIDEGKVVPNSITQFFGNGPKTGNVAPLDFGPQVASLVRLLNPASVPPTIRGILRDQGEFFGPLF